MTSDLRINVQYYDDAEKTLFAACSYDTDIAKIVGSPVKIKLEEFVGNGLLREQKNHAGYRNRQELADKIASWNQPG